MFGYVVTRHFEGALQNPSTGARFAGTNVQVIFCARCVIVHVAGSARVEVITGAAVSPNLICDNCGTAFEDR